MLMKATLSDSHGADMRDRLHAQSSKRDARLQTMHTGSKDCDCVVHRTNFDPAPPSHAPAAVSGRGEPRLDPPAVSPDRTSQPIAAQRPRSRAWSTWPGTLSEGDLRRCWACSVRMQNKQKNSMSAAVRVAAFCAPNTPHPTRLCHCARL